MNTKQFIRKIRKAGRKSGVAVDFDQSRGKGSHGTLWYGDLYTVVPHTSGDLPTGLLRAMLRDIGLTLDDI